MHALFRSADYRLRNTAGLLYAHVIARPRPLLLLKHIKQCASYIMLPKGTKKRKKNSHAILTGGGTASVTHCELVDLLFSAHNQVKSGGTQQPVVLQRPWSSLCVLGWVAGN